MIDCTDCPHLEVVERDEQGQVIEGGCTKGHWPKGLSVIRCRDYPTKPVGELWREQPK